MRDRSIACIEVGGSGLQTVYFAEAAPVDIVDGIDPRAVHADVLLLAVPGLIDGHRVVGASNLGWYDVDPAIVLGLGRTADLLLNDAEASARGEAALRQVADLTFVGLGTGVGGAVVRSGQVVSNLFGHDQGFSSALCVCGQRGCLETVAAGWALPTPLEAWRPAAIADALHRVVESHPQVTDAPIVVAGGLVRNHPSIVEELARRLPHHDVASTAAPPGAKSAAAWGLVDAAFSLDLDLAGP